MKVFLVNPIITKNEQVQYNGVLDNKETTCRLQKMYGTQRDCLVRQKKKGSNLLHWAKNPNKFTQEHSAINTEYVNFGI
jgi:hypothetical protein